MWNNKAREKVSKQGTMSSVASGSVKKAATTESRSRKIIYRKERDNIPLIQNKRRVRRKNNDSGEGRGAKSIDAEETNEG